jgi:head-tail adaptor
MLSRQYTKAISVWKSTRVADGYGGYTVTDALQYSFWAHVVTKTAFRTNENGQNYNFVQVIFTIRNRVNLDISVKDNFIKYNGLVYNIDSVTNLDLNNIDIEIYASQRN